MLRIFLNREHATQVDGAADGTEHLRKKMQSMDIDVHGNAKLCQLFLCQMWKFLSSSFIPGVLTNWTSKE
jgi:hypothetical protein